jgi:hypothetical protein
VRPPNSLRRAPLPGHMAGPALLWRDYGDRFEMQFWCGRASVVRSSFPRLRGRDVRSGMARRLKGRRPRQRQQPRTRTIADYFWQAARCATRSSRTGERVLRWPCTEMAGPRLRHRRRPLGPAPPHPGLARGPTATPPWSASVCCPWSSRSLVEMQTAERNRRVGSHRVSAPRSTSTWPGSPCASNRPIAHCCA